MPPEYLPNRPDLSDNPDNHSINLHQSENLKSQIHHRAPIIFRKKILFSLVEIDSLTVNYPATELVSRVKRSQHESSHSMLPSLYRE
jgi:hypothetical protein